MAAKCSCLVVTEYDRAHLFLCYHSRRLVILLLLWPQHGEDSWDSVDKLVEGPEPIEKGSGQPIEASSSFNMVETETVRC